MDNGTKNLGGRPKQGITKKVSLTLTPDEWSTIENSGGTVAAFIKNLMSLAPEVAAPNPPQHIDSIPISELNSYSRRDAEELWNNIIKYDIKDEYPKDVFLQAREDLFRVLFPNNSPIVVIKTFPQYQCPFTGKKFGKMDKLISAVIPKLLKTAKSDLDRPEKMKNVIERKEALSKSRYFDQMFD